MLPRAACLDSAEGETMPRSRVAKRLARAIERHKEVRRKLPPITDEKFNLDKPEDRGRLAHYALQIPEAPSALRDAFAEFDLNPKDPRDWHLLIGSMAEILFGTEGRPTKWTEERWDELLGDVAIIKLREPGKPDGAICKALKKDKRTKERYAKERAETLRRQLANARNPERNRNVAWALQFYETQIMPHVLEKAEQANVKWTVVDAMRLRARLLDLHLNSGTDYYQDEQGNMRCEGDLVDLLQGNFQLSSLLRGN
jgi:hypothetical protein